MPTRKISPGRLNRPKGVRCAHRGRTKSISRQVESRWTSLLRLLEANNVGDLPGKGGPCRIFLRANEHRPEVTPHADVAPHQPKQKQSRDLSSRSFRGRSINCGTPAVWTILPRDSSHPFLPPNQSQPEKFVGRLVGCSFPFGVWLRGNRNGSSSYGLFHCTEITLWSFASRFTTAGVAWDDDGARHFSRNSSSQFLEPSEYLADARIEIQKRAAADDADIRISPGPDCEWASQTQPDRQPPHSHRGGTGRLRQVRQGRSRVGPRFEGNPMANTGITVLAGVSPVIRIGAHTKRS